MFILIFCLLCLQLLKLIPINGNFRVDDVESGRERFLYNAIVLLLLLLLLPTPIYTLPIVAFPAEYLRSLTMPLYSRLTLILGVLVSFSIQEILVARVKE